MPYISIDTIDWKELGERASKKSGCPISYEGSSAEINLDTLDVTIHLYATFGSYEKLLITNEDINHFQLYKDENGHYAWKRPLRSSIIYGPNRQSFMVRNFVLLNIISDYIEPFILSKLNVSC